ncbi:MAG TPA: phosphatase PAP2 family protein [Rhizomicrobium sp.]|jgi:undecaprenyl-diphosphatase|nr:phosphatase PAP2 family protein [Rhizomicrobium sp.]
MLQQYDLYLFHLVNRWCGHWFLDSIVNVEEGLFLVNGGVMMAAYWWLWFERRGSKSERQRGILILMAISSFIALFLARGLADILPFRPRPMFAGIPYNQPSMHIFSNYENWSSFPSDHAAMYFALSFGVFLLWRSLGTVLMIYSLVWICLPRVYLGLHYPGDIAAGAAIGILVASAHFYLSQRKFVDRFVLQPVLAFERNHPGAFYAVAFSVSLEMAGLFADLREAIRHSSFLLHVGLLKGIFLVVIVTVLAAIIFQILRRRVVSVGSDPQASSVDSAFSQKAVLRLVSESRPFRTQG